MDDDPWGSPWTSAPSPEKTTSPTKTELEPPPRAFLSATSSPRLPAVSVESPWADDNDGFGDWTGADTATTPAPSQSGSGWGGAWGGADTPGAHGNQHLIPTPKEEGFGFGQASPIAWPGSTASPSSKNGHGFRQPSPDPWASGEFDDFRETRDLRPTPRVVVDRPSTPTSAEGLRVGTLAGQLEPVWDNELAESGPKTAAEGPAVVPKAEQDSPSSVPVMSTGEEAIDAIDAKQPRPSTSSNPRSSHSRSSSISRNDSDSDRDRQDSPITSIDEEGKASLTLPQRKVSGKIQVLVEKYDGLAKAAVDEPPMPVRRESSVTPQKTITPNPETSSEGPAEFGDFEEGEEVSSAAPTNVLEPSTPDRTMTPRGRSPVTPTRQRTPLAVASLSPAGKCPVRESPVLRPKPPRFDVDLGHVDSIFQGRHFDPPASRHDVDSALPDNIVMDTFTGISERKAWYRISRRGSSRMHNSGDTDSYRRVAWPTATVHDETLQIVRRWMEQDSITGRTTLGGGSNRTNVFNWDSAAEPVALDQIFARRVRQPRPVSLQQPVKLSPITPPVPAPPPPSTQSVLEGAKKRPVSLAGPPVAAFGWSSSPVEHGHAEPPHPTEATEPAVQRLHTLDTPPGPVTEQAPASLEPPLSQDEEEDDWGEMISSPPIDAKPMSLPTFRGPEIKPASASVGAPTLPAMAAAIPTGSPSADRVHNSSVEDLWGLSHAAKPSNTIPTDTFATADPLSLFEQPAKPTVGTTASVINTHFTPTSPIATTVPLPTTTKTHVNQTDIASPTTGTSGDTELESAVRQVVDNLPDLSYMLR